MSQGENNLQNESSSKYPVHHQPFHHPAPQGHQQPSESNYYGYNHESEYKKEEPIFFPDYQAQPIQSYPPYMTQTSMPYPPTGETTNPQQQQQQHQPPPPPAAAPPAPPPPAAAAVPPAPVATATPAQTQGFVPRQRKPYTMKKKRERWTDEEHKLFVEGLKLYNRNWKKVQEHVKTKSVVQIRSHAQKYFEKLKKNGHTDIPPPRPKRKSSHPYPSRKTSAAVLSPPDQIAQTYIGTPIWHAWLSQELNHDGGHVSIPALHEEYGPDIRKKIHEAAATHLTTETKKQKEMNFDRVYAFLGSLCDPANNDLNAYKGRLSEVEREALHYLAHNLYLALSAQQVQDDYAQMIMAPEMQYSYYPPPLMPMYPPSMYPQDTSFMSGYDPSAMTGAPMGSSSSSAPPPSYHPLPPQHHHPQHLQSHQHPPPPPHPLSLPQHHHPQQGYYPMYTNAQHSHGPSHDEMAVFSPDTSLSSNDNLPGL